MVSLDQIEHQIQTVRKFYPDSLYSQQLKIPPEGIDDFVYFCAVDSTFSSIIERKDKLKIWGFLEKKSPIYHKNNDFDLRFK